MHDEPHPGVDDIVAQAVTTFLPSASAVEPVGGRRHLARVATPDGDLRVRHWPVATAPERVEFLHRLLRATAPAGLTARPGLGDDRPSWVRVDGEIVDVQTWLPGRSLDRGDGSSFADGRAVHQPRQLAEPLFRSLIEAVARWHDAGEQFAAGGRAPAAPLTSVVRSVRQSWGLARSRLRPLAPTNPPIQRWLRTGEQILPAAEDALAAVSHLDNRPPVVAHLALWPGHVLAARQDGGERVSGLLDAGEAALASPLLDLAQAITRCGRWSVETAETALAAYADVRRLAPEERRVLPAVTALELVTTTGRALQIAYASDIDRGSRTGTAARTGVLELLASLDALAPAVIRAADPVPHAKRQRLARAQRPRPDAAPAKPRSRRADKRRGTGGQADNDGTRT